MRISNMKADNSKKSCEIYLKRNIGRKFCDSVGRTAPLQKVWKTINKMSGNGVGSHLMVGSRTATSSGVSRVRTEVKDFTF